MSQFSQTVYFILLAPADQVSSLINMFMGYTSKTFGLAVLLILFMLPVAAQVPACSTTQSFKIVVLGSSTAAGTGPSSSDSAWVNRYRKYLQGINPGNQVINLAVGGTTTYHIMPTGFVAATPGRPVPNTQHNITKAISLNPDAIIINMPSNDASFGFPPAEQMYNFDSLIAAGEAAGIPVWICTTQPRNNLFTKTQWQIDVKDSILARYGNRAIDFWNTLATPTGTLEPLYNPGDGIHLNNAGHRILFERTKDRQIPTALCSDTVSTDSTFIDYAIHSLQPEGLSDCGNSNLNWQVVFRNAGSDDTSGIVIHFLSTWETGNTTQAFSQTLSGSPAAGTTDTIHFGSQAAISGDYAVQVWIAAPGDQEPANDTLRYTFSVTDAAELTVFHDTVCSGNTALLSAQTTADSLYWYQSLQASTPFHSGATFTTPPLDSAATWYVQAVRGTSVSTTMADSLHTSYNSTHNWNGVMFDLIAHENIVLDSLALKMFTTGSQVIDVYRKNGSYKGHESNAASWTVVRSGTVNVSSAGQVVRLNLDSLPMNANDTSGIYVKLRNHIGKLAYRLVPSEVTVSSNELEMVSGTGITHGWGATYFPRQWNGSVFYHHATTESESCKSALTAVQALVHEAPAPLLTADTTIGENDSILLHPGNFSSYLWSTGDTTATILFKASVSGIGEHNIQVTVSNEAGCTATDSMLITVVPDITDTNLVDSVDYSIVALTSPDSVICGDTALRWQVILGNPGPTDPHGGLLLFTHSGPLSSPVISQVIVNGMASMATDTFFFTINAADTGTHYVKVRFVPQAADYQPANDSIDSSVLVIGPAEVSVFHDTVCPNTAAQLQASAGPADVIEWYEQSGGGVPVFVGTQFITPAIDSSRSWFVRASGLCNSSLTEVRAIVNPAPAPALGADTIQINTNDSIELYAGNYSHYLWSTGDTTASVKLFGDSLGTGLHQLSITVFDQKGCSGSDSIYLLIEAIPEDTVPAPVYADCAIISLFPLSPDICGSATQDWKVVVANTGEQASKAKISFVSQLPSSLPLLQEDSLTDSLYPGQSDTLHFMINTLQGGTYVVSAEVFTEVNDTNSLNNILTDSLTVTGTPPVSVFHDTVCQGSTAILEAATGEEDTLLWYDQPGGSLLSGGSTFVTPPLTAPASWYVQALRGSFTSVANDSLHTTFTHTHQWNGVMFDLVAHEDLVLDSFAVKMFTTGSQVIDVYQRQGSYKGHELNAASWSVVRTDVLHVNSQGQICYADLAGLSMAAGDTFGIYLKLRNHIGKLTYRSVNQEISRSTNALEIITGTGITHGYLQSYFPRDWNGSVFYHSGGSVEGLCKSPATEVIANVATAIPDLGPDLSLTLEDSIVLNGGSFNNYTWSTGDTSASLPVKGHLLGVGTHLLVLQVTDENGCNGSDSILLHVTSSSMAKMKATAGNLKLFPNPTDGNFTLSSTTALAGGQLLITNQLGQIMYQHTFGEEEKAKTENFDFNHWAAGCYYVTFKSPDVYLFDRLIIRR